MTVTYQIDRLKPFYVRCFGCGDQVQAVRYGDLWGPPDDWSHLWAEGFDPKTHTVYASDGCIKRAVRNITKDLDEPANIHIHRNVVVQQPVDHINLSLHVTEPTP